MEQNKSTDQHIRNDQMSGLYVEFNDALVRYLNVKLHSMDDAQDVAHEAYARILGLNQTDTINHLQAYLFKTASNILIDRIRAQNRHPTCGLEEVQEELQSNDSSNEEAVFAAQQIQELQQIIKELPAKCRMAFLLYKFEGLEYGEIASRMQLTESMIRKYVLRAVVYCRERMELLQGEQI